MAAGKSVDPEPMSTPWTLSGRRRCPPPPSAEQQKQPL